jgi:hypothetical protein
MLLKINGTSYKKYGICTIKSSAFHPCGPNKVLKNILTKHLQKFFLAQNGHDCQKIDG